MSEGWGAREGVLIHSRKGLGWFGSSHEKTLKLKMSVEAIQIHFVRVTNFACETRQIIQALRVGVFKPCFEPHHQSINLSLFIWSLVAFLQFPPNFPTGH